MAFSKESLGFFPAIIPFRFPGVPGVSACFSTGLYGNISLEFGLSGAEDIKRRAALAPLLGFDGWTELKQVHGDTLLIDPPVTPFDAPSALEADGSATCRPRQALLSKAADCQQILLAHKSGKYVAALHCGWKGNSIGFPASGLDAFCRAYDISPRDVMAVRGPSLGPGEAEFVNFAAEWSDEFLPWFNPKTNCMDLWSLTRHQLARCGMPPENIFSIDLCTKTFSDFLFSFRCGHAGRQAALVFIES